MARRLVPTKHEVREPRLTRVVEFMVAAATENWGTKIMAFLLAAIVFIVTRDEVTRSFTIPLRVIEDPDRVLLTEPPATVEVSLRGPWANVNRIAATELGPATLDLREVRAGPMALDPASVVMPRGVVLDTLVYDPVDLRFEAIIDRNFEILAVVEGSVDADYRLVSTRVEPERWPVRGPSTAVARLDHLRSQIVDIDGIRADLDLHVEFEPLPSGLELVQAGEDPPTLRFIADVEPIAGELELVVATAESLHEALPKLDETELPATESVTVRGPKFVLREIAALDSAVVAVVEVERPEQRGGPLPITLRFEWSADVPEATRSQLSIVPPLIRLRLASDGLESPE